VTTGRNTNQTLEIGIVAGIGCAVEHQRGRSFRAISDDSWGERFLFEGLSDGLFNCRSTWLNVKVAKFEVHKVNPGNTNSVNG